MLSAAFSRCCARLPTLRYARRPVPRPLRRCRRRSSRSRCWPNRCWSRCRWSFCSSTGGRSGAARRRRPPLAAGRCRCARSAAVPAGRRGRGPDLPRSGRRGASSLTRPVRSACASANALVAYVAYLAKTLWPAGLSPFYPLGRTYRHWQVAGAALAVAGVTARRRARGAARPWLAVGLALVARDAGAGDRPVPGRRPGDGGPLHLSPPHPALRCGGVVGCPGPAGQRRRALGCHGRLPALRRSLSALRPGGRPVSGATTSRCFLAPSP